MKHEEIILYINKENKKTKFIFLARTTHQS
jgi:hypothetical protein